MNRDALILNRPTRQAYREERLTSGGYPIVLSVWEAEAAASPRGTLVFSPGTGDHPLLYAGFLEGLAAEGYNIVGIHFAGTGKSPRIDLGYRWDTFKQNVRDAVAYARAHLKGPVGLMGSSQGGILTLQMLAELETLGPIDLAICHNLGVPAEADALVLTTLPRFIQTFRWLPELIINVTSALFPNWSMPLRFYLNEDGIFDDPTVARINREDPLKNRYLPYRFFYSFITSRPALPLRDIETPILVLTGERDPIFPLAYVRQTFDRIGAPDKALTVFPGRGHLFMVERPQEALAPTLEWLNARRPVGAAA